MHLRSNGIPTLWSGAFSSATHSPHSGTGVPHTPTQPGNTPHTPTQPGNTSNIPSIQSAQLPAPQPNNAGSWFGDDPVPWLFENDLGFNFYPPDPVEPTSVNNPNDAASINSTPTPGRPAVLTAMDRLKERERACQ
ncbi:hypothetical protein [Hydrogenophaga intermedia]|uniref:hypothetical protein n=1 Tax=Hydrogenophaga intermedia TaxID=65786 RepID=UPI002044825E|nr:hypothetical protein [Hydrogenophaga intermedia]